ncbi:beta-N-acetylhexosaminidase [Oxalobacter vibrioformis]|uniref:Beta-hexosaminidase n=1 Tax=Oxalobacter vibrioformis TaxID=933080 RepID=A0A9E9P3A0_9BURK|nr:beta-N-acetylhexosaminidase [Oxalobacter vibrioformis]WAW10784.1 beta-N-acetylhexosaminidase [Oxalobacter vibrioformis]
MKTAQNATKKPGPVMLDVVGLTLNEEDIRRIRHPLTGGVILFARNYTDRAQLVALTKAIRAVRDDVLIAVDHEGGRVQRFRDGGFTHLPAMRRLGELWDENPSIACKTATATGYVLATELRACGVDMSFTPVLDLDYGESGVIGNRAFHSEPRVVAKLAQSLNYGLAMAGMANCGKHFPGHGFVKEDSHHEVPIDSRSLEEIMEKDAAPYFWMGIGLAGVMPAHIIYPQVDPNPAGFSAKWLTILREELEFDGVIFSDDLSMEGARVAGSTVDGAKAALAAGCDMVLICNSPDKADKILTGLEYLENDATRQSRERLIRLFPEKAALGWDALHQEAQYRHALEAVSALMQS